MLNHNKVTLWNYYYMTSDCYWILKRSVVESSPALEVPTSVYSRPLSRFQAASQPKPSVSASVR